MSHDTKQAIIACENICKYLISKQGLARYRPGRLLFYQQLFLSTDNHAIIDLLRFTGDELIKNYAFLRGKFPLEFEILEGYENISQIVVCEAKAYINITQLPEPVSG